MIYVHIFSLPIKIVFNLDQHKSHYMWYSWQCMLSKEGLGSSLHLASLCWQISSHSIIILNLITLGYGIDKFRNNVTN